MPASFARSTLFVLVVFGLALFGRLVVFDGPHMEGDEFLYRTLMEQVRSGEGYTLRGHWVLDTGAYAKEIYDQPVFPQHPPGGVLFFLLCDLAVPGRGAAVAQLVAFGMFFFGVLVLLHAVDPKPRPLGFGIAALAAGWSPVAVHVLSRHWLDGPLLGFATLAAGGYLLGVRDRRPAIVVTGVALFTYALWIKTTAIVILPGLLALSISIAGADARREARKAALLLAVAVLAGVVPWAVWQASVGMGFGVSARPTEALIRSNRYIEYVTEIRSAWIYFSHTPTVFWTLLPSCLLVWLQRDREDLQRRWLALLFWIVGVLALFGVLGAVGYSKLLRYAILVSPAVIVLFASATQHYFYAGERGGSRGLRLAVLLAVALGLTLEIAQGVVTASMLDQPWIVPLHRLVLGGAG